MISETYDRLAVGERLRTKRRLLGYSQGKVAEKIGKVPKYYADIERGSCGMSVETMLALADVLNLSLDYIVYGDEEEQGEKMEESKAIVELLSRTSEEKRKYAKELLRMFLAACGE